ncbi:MAG: VWA domain-containing protein [Planctomycetota bacterium]
MMSYANDDPRLTAMALGELTEQEQADFLEEVGGLQELSADLEEIKSLAASLQSALQAEWTRACETEPNIRLEPEFLTDAIRPKSGWRSMALKVRNVAALLALAISTWAVWPVSNARLEMAGVPAAGPQLTPNNTTPNALHENNLGKVLKQEKMAQDESGPMVVAMDLEQVGSDKNREHESVPVLAKPMEVAGLSKTTMQGLGGRKDVPADSYKAKVEVASAPTNRARMASPAVGQPEGYVALGGMMGGYGPQAGQAGPQRVGLQHGASNVAVKGEGKAGAGVKSDVAGESRFGYRPGLENSNVSSLATSGKPLAPPSVATANGSTIAMPGLQTTDRAMALNRLSDQSGKGNSKNEAYAQIVENPFMEVKSSPLSTFSIDVDTASYANVRRFLNQGQLPPANAVRIEELLNYFNYEDQAPTGEEPLGVNVQVGPAPWNVSHRLARVALRARDIEGRNRPLSNLVFLIDTSGSMQPANKLPLLVSAFKMLVDQLGENDRVAIVTYAGSAGLLLPSTTGDQKQVILNALESLQAGGSTNGAQGIHLAYEVARANFIKGGANRVILATDGDFNVGVSNPAELVRMAEEKAKTGIFLNVLGFGMGNLKDATLEQVADKGNGMYAYIDDLREARKVFVEQISGTLVTVAKDVKLQLEFNPAKVSRYRLIGYENRALKDEDFANDAIDAGDVGAGHRVVALYELVPAGTQENLRYSKVAGEKPEESITKPSALSDEILFVKLRYKKPEEMTSRLMTLPIVDEGKSLPQMGTEFRFSAAVAGFGMQLRNSAHKGQCHWELISDLAGGATGPDKGGYRSEFMGLVQKAKALTTGPKPEKEPEN